MGDTSARELGVSCRKCSAPIGVHCTSPAGNRVNWHSTRTQDAYADIADELAANAEQRAHERRMFEAQYDDRTLVALSFGYSCGCADGPSEPIPLRDANTAGVARAIICDTHDEYAVVTRVTTRLVADETTLKRILAASGIGDDLDVSYVAGDQNDDARLKRVEAGGTGEPT